MGELPTFGHTTSISEKSLGYIVPPGGDRALPRRFMARVEIEGAPLVATLRIEIDADGAATCRSVEFAAADGGPVTGTDLRAVGLTKMIGIAVGAATQRVTERSADGGLVLASPSATEVDRFRAEMRTRRPRIRPDDELLLRKVADVYTRAEKAPTKAVERECYVSRSTAGRLIAEARRHGLLPPAQRGGPDTEKGED